MKDKNINLLFIISIILFIIFLSLYYIHEKKNSCSLKEPFLCSNPQLGNDGMIISIKNKAKEDIYIQDLTISQKGKNECYFLNSKIKNLSQDSYGIIPTEKAVSFFISSNHPDGKCFMEEMEHNKNYKFIINITYFLNDEKINTQGKGNIDFQNKNIYLTSE